MNVGVVGSGKIGATGLFADAGHDVAVSNSRGPEWLVPLVEETGSNTRAATVEGGRRLRGSGAGGGAARLLRWTMTKA